MTVGDTDRHDRLAAVTLDPASIGAGSPHQEHERRVAIVDLIERNSFALHGHANGPYHLMIGLHGGKLAFDIRSSGGEPVIVHLLALQPFRRLLRDYMMICESHVAALRTATPDQIQAIDMGRRGLHDEGAMRLGERLHGKVRSDHETLRRLFTLITALHWKG